MSCRHTSACLLFFAMLQGCAPEPAKTTHDSCSAKSTIAFVDRPVQTVHVAGGSIIGQHLIPINRMTLYSFTLYASSPGVTSAVVRLYKADPSDQTVATEPILNFNVSLNFTSATVVPLKIRLPTPIQLDGIMPVLISVAPDSPMNLQWGTSDHYNALRSIYRTGTGSGGPGGGPNWGVSAEEKGLSIALESDAYCSYQ